MAKNIYSIVSSPNYFLGVWVVSILEFYFFNQDTNKKISSPKGLLSSGRGCPGKWLSCHPWRYWKTCRCST